MARIIVGATIDERAGWKLRIDKPRRNQPQDQRHVHIWRAGLKGEYSWNIDGSRHDQGRFPEGEQCIKRAKELAADYLRVDAAILQLITDFPGGGRVFIGDAEPEKGVPPLVHGYIGVEKFVAVFGWNASLVVVIGNVNGGI